MNSIRVIANQSILDLALQEYGDVRAAFDMAITNGQSISQALAVNQELNLPESELQNIDILKYYKSKNIKPANANTEGLVVEENPQVAPDDCTLIWQTTNW